MNSKYFTILSIDNHENWMVGTVVASSDEEFMDKAIEALKDHFDMDDVEFSYEHSVFDGAASWDGVATVDGVAYPLEILQTWLT